MKSCDCGCGKEIKVKFHHKYYGDPKFIHGHNPPWNKNLTKETDLRILKLSESVKHTIQEKSIGFLKGYIPWNKERKMPIEAVQKRIETCKINKIKKNCIYSGEELTLFLCKCGCGEIVGDNKSKKLTYIHGHNSVKTKWFWSKKNQKQVYYQSSYELASFELLEKMEIVKSYERCPYIIDYSFEGKIHKYIPDILITYDDGRQEVVEIKPAFRLTEEINKSKFGAAKEYFDPKKIGFSVWTEKELRI